MGPTLTEVRIWMTEYIMSIFLALGVLGNLINVYIFARKNFRRNSCSMYLLAESFVNVFIVSWGIGPALYDLNYVDPSVYSFAYCKLRLYSIHTLLMIGRTFIVFACLDRYALCSQSVRLRSFCVPKIAIRVIIVVPLVWPVLTLHVLILENFYGNKCSMSGAYVLIYGIYSTIVAGIIPPLFMTILSVLTIRNRQRLRTRLSTTGVNNRRDQALIIMLSSEVIVYVTTTFLYPTNTLYGAITSGITKSTERQQIESFISFLGGSFLIYLNSASVFYVFFAVSKSFRKECKVAFRSLIGIKIRQGDRVEPMATQANEILHRDTHF